MVFLNILLLLSGFALHNQGQGNVFCFHGKGNDVCALTDLCQNPFLLNEVSHIVSDGVLPVNTYALFLGFSLIVPVSSPFQLFPLAKSFLWVIEKRSLP